MDLLSDFGATEPFLVCGDSLVIEALANSDVDKEHGGQFLQVCFAVERFLKRFRDRGARFTVVFFRDYRKLLFRSCPSLCDAANESSSASWAMFVWQLIVSRELVLRHLHALSDVDVECKFANWYDPAWPAFVRAKNPAFVMASDGEVLTHYVSASAHARDIVHALRSFSVCTSGLRQSVVFCSGVACRDQKMLGFTVRSTNEMANTIELHKADMECEHSSIFSSDGSNVYTELERALSLDIDGAAAALASGGGTNAAAQAPSDGDAGLDWRLSVGARSCGILLAKAKGAGESAPPVSHGIAKAFLVHQVMLRYLPLRQRAQPATIIPDSDVSNDGNAKVAAAARAFLVQWYPVALSMLALPFSSDNKGAPAFCDLMDGRLFCRCAAILVSPAYGHGKEQGVDGLACLGFSRAMAEELATAWNLCTSVAGKPTPLLPLVSVPEMRTLAVHSGGLLVLGGAPKNNPSSAKSADKAKPDIDVAAPPSAMGWEDLVAVDSKLLASAMGSDAGKNTAAVAGSATTSPEGNLERAATSANCDILSDWRVDANLHTDMSIPPKSTFVARGRSKRLSSQARQEQRKQRYLANIHKYAASLQGNGELHAKVIVVDKTDRAAEASGAGKAEKKKSHRSGGKDNKSKSKKNLIQEANERKQAERDAKDAEKKWKTQKDEIGRQKTLESKFFLFEKYAKICRHPAILLDMYIYKLDTLCTAHKMAMFKATYG